MPSEKRPGLIDGGRFSLASWAILRGAWAGAVLLWPCQRASAADRWKLQPAALCQMWGEW